MKTSRLFLVTILITTMVAGVKLSSFLLATQESGRAASDQSALLKSFAEIEPIDVHTHIYKDDPELNALIERLKLRVVNICVIDDRDPDFKGLEPQRTEVLKVRQSTLGRGAFCTTFSPYAFEQPGFSACAIRQLNEDFAQGAVAVKIYKVMGMEMKNHAGKWVMADDPAFEPIYRDIASHHRTLIAHLAEPDSCWQPANPASPDYSYYKEHPGEYAYAHPEWPSKEAILAARDHLLAENPKLRVVGAHLGSMETNVDDIARRFDLYPNFAVDMAARIPYFMLQPREKVRAFLLKYQDRALYATDLVVFSRSKTKDTLAEFRKTYARDWKFFSTDQNVEYLGHMYRGLALPPVLSSASCFTITLCVGSPALSAARGVTSQLLGSIENSCEQTPHGSRRLIVRFLSRPDLMDAWRIYLVAVPHLGEYSRHSRAMNLLHGGRQLREV